MAETNIPTPEKATGPVLVDYSKTSTVPKAEVHVESAVETAARIQKANMWRDRLFPSIGNLGERLAQQAANTLKTTFVQFTMGMAALMLNEVLYGGKAQIPQNGTTGAINYTNYSQPGRVAQPQGSAVAQVAQFQGFVFNSNDDAQAVLRGMDDALNANGSVTVANYKELCGMESAIDNTDFRRGWTDLSRVTVKRSWGENTWYLALPQPANLYQ